MVSRNKNGLIREEDLSRLISFYSKRPTKIMGFHISEVETSGINSEGYLLTNILRDDENYLTYQIYLKRYLLSRDIKVEESGPEMLYPATHYESEKAFYRFAQKHLIFENGERRVVPPCLNSHMPFNDPTKKKLDKEGIILLEAYERKNIIGWIKDRIDYKGKIITEDIFPFIVPLVFLWVKATAYMHELGKELPMPKKLPHSNRRGRIEENKYRIYRPSSRTYKERLAGSEADKGYIDYILESKEIEVSDEEKRLFREAFGVLAHYISAKGKEGLESIVHGDCTPTNHLGTVLIDPSLFRISAWPLDLAYLLKNPYFDQLGLNDREIIQYCINHINKVRIEHLMMSPLEIDTNEALKSLYVCAFYGAIRNFGVSLKKRKTSEPYRESLEKDPAYELYRQQHLANSKSYLQRLLKLENSTSEEEAVEEILRLGKKWNLFKQLERNRHDDERIRIRMIGSSIGVKDVKQRRIIHADKILVPA